MPVKITRWDGFSLNKRSAGIFPLRGKLFLLIAVLCVMAASMAAYLMSVDNNASSSNLELTLNENEIEYVEELPDAEFYTGARQLYSDSTQNILDPSSVAWSTSDSMIAEIKDNGAIIPKSAGTVTITGEYKGLKASSTVHIKKGEIIDLSITEKNVTLAHSLHKKGSQNPYELVLFATTTAGNQYDITYNGDVVWKSEDANIATVKSGYVFSVRPGKVKMAASFKGLTAETEINFVDNKIINVRFGKNAIKLEEINVIEEIQLLADFDDGSSVDISKYATWESQNPDVAIVSGGMLISKGEGVTKITAKYEEYNCSIEVTVKKSQDYTSE